MRFLRNLLLTKSKDVRNMAKIRAIITKAVWRTDLVSSGAGDPSFSCFSRSGSCEEKWLMICFSWSESMEET